MTKVTIISGFLGAGKTTLIRKLLEEAFQGEQIVLIENEFGEIGIDGGFLKDAGIQVSEMNSGCICCTLVGDFGKAIKEVLATYHPDRILIEPSGVGKLSDVMAAVQQAAEGTEMTLSSNVTVVDCKKCKMYLKNFGEFYKNQVHHAGTVVLSRTQDVTQEKLEECVAMIREMNEKAALITTPWDEIDGSKILEAMESQGEMARQLMEEALASHLEHEREHHHDHEHEEHEHHHDHDHEHEHHHDHEHEEHEHHHEHDHEEHGHHHDHEHEEHGHHHDHEHEEHGHHHDHEHEGHEHHHDHEHEEHGHHHDHEHEEHEHHHEHDHEEHEHHHDHGHHHHHHDADEVFGSWGVETPVRYTKEQIENILHALDDHDTYGMVLRAKGMVAGADGKWIYFDMVPEETEIREGAPEYTGRLCVIGSQLKEDALKKLFGV